MLILRPVTRECQPASILLGCREFRQQELATDTIVSGTCAAGVREQGRQRQEQDTLPDVRDRDTQPCCRAGSRRTARAAVCTSSERSSVSLACRERPSRKVLRAQERAATLVPAGSWPSATALCRRSANICLVFSLYSRTRAMISVSEGQMFTAASTTMQPQGVEGESRMCAASSKKRSTALQTSGSSQKRRDGSAQ